MTLRLTAADLKRLGPAAQAQLGATAPKAPRQAKVPKPTPALPATWDGETLTLVHQVAA